MSPNDMPGAFDLSRLFSAANHYTEPRAGGEVDSPNFSPPPSEASSFSGSSHSTGSTGTYQTALASARVDESPPSSFPMATGSQALNLPHLFQEFTKFFGAYLVQHLSVNNPNPVPDAGISPTRAHRASINNASNFSPGLFGALPPHVSNADPAPLVHQISNSALFSEPARPEIDPLSIALQQFAPPSLPSQYESAEFLGLSPGWMSANFPLDPHPLTPSSAGSKRSHQRIYPVDSSAEGPPPPLPRSSDVPLFFPAIDSALHSQSNNLQGHNVTAPELPPYLDTHDPPVDLFEDDGNEADTETFPMFSARTRAKKRLYTGDALVSPDDARNERETAPRRSRGGVRATRTPGLPRRRPGYKIRLADQVRHELASLLGMDKDKSLVDVCQALSNNELNAFTAIWNTSDFHHFHANCCDINNFYIDLVYTPRSPWNQSASRVFTVHFIRKFKLSTSNDMMNIVREAFYIRVKSLHALLRREQGGQEAIALSLQATRRWLRKQTLYNNRLLATAHPRLQRYRPIIVGLGVAGMSTDESDQDATNPTQLSSRIFRVRVPVWRASSLTLLLRWIDKMYLLLRRMSKTLRGALPRIRIAPDADTEASIRSQAYASMASFPLLRARFVNNLPKCAYDITWFGIFLGDGFDLRYTDEEWDFTIDLQLIEFFERYLSLNVLAPENA